jgi:hypothetical protein
MNTAIVSFLVDQPWFAANTLVTAAIPGAALAYAVVWWAMRPSDGRRAPRAFALHAVGLITTVAVSALCRVISIATFGGRDAFELSGSGVAALYILVIPAIVAATFLAWRRRGLITSAAPDATFAASNQAHASMKSTAGLSKGGDGKEAPPEEFAQIEAGRVDRGIWSRAYADSDDDESKA